ncbi:hypothetical protein [uncultured Duncaniella sp.]|nr:hypothetical protein [uncultured Duncaniella sp.]
MRAIISNDAAYILARRTGGGNTLLLTIPVRRSTPTMVFLRNII